MAQQNEESENYNFFDDMLRYQRVNKKQYNLKANYLSSAIN